MRPTTSPLLPKPPRFYHHFLRLGTLPGRFWYSKKPQEQYPCRTEEVFTTHQSPTKNGPRIASDHDSRPENEWMFEKPQWLRVFSRFKWWKTTPFWKKTYITPDSTLVGGFNQPTHLKKCLSNYIFSPGRIGNKEYSKPPPKTYLTPGLANLSQELWLQRLHAKAETSEKTCWTWLA